MNVIETTRSAYATTKRLGVVATWLVLMCWGASAHAQISPLSPSPDDRLQLEPESHALIPIFTQPGTQVLATAMPQGMTLESPRGRALHQGLEVWLLRWDTPEVSRPTLREDFYEVRLEALRPNVESLPDRILLSVAVTRDFEGNGLVDKLAPATQDHALEDQAIGFARLPAPLDPDMRTTSLLPFDHLEPACKGVGVDATAPHSHTLEGSPRSPGVCTVLQWSRFNGFAVARTLELQVDPNRAPTFDARTPPHGEVLEVERGRDLELTIGVLPDAGPQAITLRNLDTRDGDSLVPLGTDAAGNSIWSWRLRAPVPDAMLGPGESARFVSFEASDGAITTRRDFVVDFILPPTPSAAPTFVGRTPEDGARIRHELGVDTAALIILDVYDQDTPPEELDLRLAQPVGEITRMGPGTFVFSGSNEELVETAYVLEFILSDGQNQSTREFLLQLDFPVEGEGDADIQDGEGGEGVEDPYGPMMLSGSPDEGCCSQTPSSPSQAPLFSLLVFVLGYATLKRHQLTRAPSA